MTPTRAIAEVLLQDSQHCNPGAWVSHSRIAAQCAEKIAQRCCLDPDKAYVLGLLHDIGRKFGVRHLGHVADGYSYMLSLGYDEVARVCLTHSFNNQTVEEYIGENDTTQEEYHLIKSALEEIAFDEYDRLIQLSDALAGSQGVLDIEKRMLDVKARYGFYPDAKWHRNMELKAYFEDKAGSNIYCIVGKDSS